MFKYVSTENTKNSVDVFLSGVKLNMNQNILPCRGSLVVKII